jgi:hypothetical protein
MTAVTGPKLFISYRREGTAMHAGRLYDTIAARHGERNVFMDLEMAPGVDFVERITSAVGACRVLLVVIGPQWAGERDGRPRIADPADFVRLEVETALRAADVTVIPVLVEGARMPAPEELPPELQPLARRNAIELSDLRWRYDCQRLMAALDELLGDRPRRRSASASPSRWRALVPLWIEGVVLAIVAGVLARSLAGLVSTGSDVHELVVRRAVVWAAVAAVLALWLSLRRGDQGRLLRRVAEGLLYGALAGALGALVYGLARDVSAVHQLLSTQHSVAVASLAITGGLLGLGLGALWIPPRAAAGLLAGACGGGLAQIALNSFDPHHDVGDVIGVGCQCLGIFGCTLLVLLALDVRSAARAPAQVVAAPEAARA